MALPSPLSAFPASCLGLLLFLPGHPPHARKLSGPLARMSVADITDFHSVPGGERVVYLADQEFDERYELYSASLDPLAGGSTRISPPIDEFADVLPGFAVNSAGRVVFRVAFPFANAQLWSAPADGSAPAVLLSRRTVPEFRLTRDGSRVVFSQVGGLATPLPDLWSVPADGSAPPVQLLGSRRGQFLSFAIAPDGAHVVFLDDRFGEGLQELFSVPIDGSAPPVRLNQALSGTRDVTAFRISADGTQVVYRADQTVDEVHELFLVPVDGSATPVRLSPVLPPERDVEAEFEFTPDGQRVVFRADLDVDDVPELYGIEVAPGSTAVKLGPALGPGEAVRADFRISADGTRVVHRIDRGEATELWSAPVDGSTPAVRLHEPLAPGRVAGPFEIRADSARVVFLAEQALGGERELFSAPIDGSSAALRLTPALVAGGDVASFELAGDLVVYRADQELDEVLELYSVPSSGGAAVRIHPPLPPGRSVQPEYEIAPESARVLYLADAGMDEVFELYGADLRGGAEPRVLNDPALATPAVSGDVTGFLILEDLAVFRADAEVDDVFALYSVPFDGSRSPVRITAPPSAGTDVPAFIGTRDGWVLYREDPGDGTRRLASVRADGAAQPRVLAEDAVLAYLVPGSDPARVLFEVARPEGRELFGVPLDGSESAVSISSPNVSASDLRRTSPDGTTVVYLSNEVLAQRLELYAAPLDGSRAPVRLDPSPHRDFGTLHGFRITPDSRRVVYRSDKEHRGRIELYSVPIDGSAPAARLSSIAAPGGDVQRVQISADSAHVVYAADQTRNDWPELYSAPVDGSRPAVRLGPGDTQIITSYALTADGHRVVFAASGNPPAQLSTVLYTVPIDGGAPAVPISGPVLDYWLTPDGRQVVCVVAVPGFPFGQAHLELFSAPTDGSAPPTHLAGPLRARSSVSLRFAPDGQTLLYVAYLRNGDSGLFRQSVLGGSPTKLCDPAFVRDFSPDGTRALVSSFPNLLTVPLSGDAPAVQVNGPLVPGGVAQFGGFTSDGRVLYVADQEQDGVNELYIGGGPLRPRNTPARGPTRPVIGRIHDASSIGPAGGAPRRRK